MGGFNIPDAPLVRYVSIQVEPKLHDAMDEKRKELKMTWSQFFLKPAVDVYMGE